jgi:hypothetical protein
MHCQCCKVDWAWTNMDCEFKINNNNNNNVIYSNYKHEMLTAIIDLDYNDL